MLIGKLNNILRNISLKLKFVGHFNHRHLGHGFRFLLPPFLYYTDKEILDLMNYSIAILNHFD
jgi:hypothetical protein